MTNKKCTRCFKTKPQDDFYKRSGKRSHEYYSYCKACFIKFVVQRWVRIKQESVAYKGGKCQDCNGVFHYAVFEFHHRDPDAKENNWVQVRKWKKDKREQELDKCDLLCANCHRMRHVTGRGEMDITSDF